MSLTMQQTLDTKAELKENFALAGKSIEEVAADLHTTPGIIENTLILNTRHIEDPWVLKAYLEEIIADQGLTPVTFSALRGDYHQYWFLNSRRIDQRKIG